jgi:cytochrome c oxidase subunit 2
MDFADQPNRRRVLIASSHALFGQGLRSLLKERQQAGVEVVGMVSNLEEAIAAIDELNPDLVIVDYDDEKLNRDEFLARFVESEKKLRVVLLSLQSEEGRTTHEAIVYDRRTLAASQIDDWLEEWTLGDEAGRSASRDRMPTMEKSPPTKSGELNNNKHRRNDMRHLVIAGILVAIVTAALIFGLEQVQLLPTQASAQAKPIDDLFRLEFMVIAFLFALIVVFMLYSIVVFRRKPGDTEDAAHIEGNTKLEIAWTVAPLATVLFFAFLGGQSLADTLRADPRPLQVDVTGRQWSWSFEYPEYGIISESLVLPVNKQAILNLSSADVIHSFWVPEFRVKQDALPGGEEFVRELRITPTIEGEYKVRCAELCGINHATMLAPVRVVSDAEFEAWITSELDLPEDPVLRGEMWATQNGCLSCHSLDGSRLVGPSWLNVCGSQEALADGSSVTVDEAYLYESIVNPGAKVVQGYPDGVMPATYGADLSDAQIDDIIAYICSVK